MTDTARPDTARPDAALADAVAGLMPRAREDLARLVAMRSVADADVEPVSECIQAAEEVLRLFRRGRDRGASVSPEEIRRTAVAEALFLRALGTLPTKRQLRVGAPPAPASGW